jgi:hypothetical protein
MVIKAKGQIPPNPTAQRWNTKFNGIFGKEVRNPEEVHPTRSYALYKHKPKVYSIGNFILNVYSDTNSLNRSVAELIKQEMQQGGLAILPADSTHGDEDDKPKGEIYAFLDKLFSKSFVPDDLTVSHMDELKDGNTSFSKSLRSWLPKLIQNLGDRFKAIDINNFEPYKKLLERGPRLIVGGIGAAVPPHVAYIGEEQNSLTGKQILNEGPKKIKLRPEESKRRNCTHAYTMGMDSFNAEKNKKLKTVILTAKGEKKAPAVIHALKEALGIKKSNGESIERSACGQILKRFADNNDHKGPKLVLNIDKAIFSKIIAEEELIKQLLIRS